MIGDLDALPYIADPSYKWSVYETDHDGMPLFIRCNITAEEWMGHAELPIKLGFAVPFQSLNKQGVPDANENEALNAVENLIFHYLNTQTKGVHALVLTTGRMKEFVFYIPRNVDVQAIHKNIRQAAPEHDIQCMAVHEPDWKSFQLFGF